MLSLLAVTSVSMGAYADATLSVIQNAKEGDWTGSNFKWNGGIITSPNGTAVSLPVSLLPGKYTLSITATTGSVKLTALGISSTTGTVSFEVPAGTSAQPVTITLVSTDGKEFAAKDFVLTLNYDFGAAGDYLTTALSKVITKINVSDLTIANALKTKATNIAVGIDSVKSSTSYDIYQKYQLYKGTYDKCTIMPRINALSAEVDAANNNDAAYQKFITAYKTILSNLTWVEKKLNTASAYAKTKYANDTLTYSNNLKADKTAADVAYSNTTAGSIDVAAFVKKYDITILSKNIDAANLNDSAYNAVAQLITIFKTNYDVVLKNLISVLPSTNDVYGDMLTKAQNELLIVKKVEDAAEKNNGTYDSHDGAAANINGASGTKAIVLKATTDIQTINTLYTDSATKLKGAYSVAIAAVSAKQSVLDGYLLIAKNIGKTYTNDSTAIQTAINALSAKIANANKVHTIDTLNYSGDLQNIVKLEDAFGKIITAAKVNYDNNTTTVTLNKALTKALSDAKKVVEAYISADTKYTAKDRYPKVYQALSNQIQGYITGAANAYKAGTSDKYYNAHQDSIKTGGITATAIAAYQNNASAALAKYNTVAPAIAGYRTLYNKLDSIVTDKEVTNAQNVTYGSLLVDADTTITKLENALKAAVALKDNDHIKAITAITLNSKITDNLVANTTNYKSDKIAFDKAISLNAATSMLQQAQTSLDGMTTLLNSYKMIYTRDTLGLSYEKIVNTTLAGLITKVANEQTVVGEIDPSADATKAIATLSVINDSISMLKGYIDSMETAARTAMANVTDNKNQYKISKTVWNGYNDSLNGNIKLNIKGVADLIVDPGKDLNSTISNLNNSLKVQSDAIEAAKNTETLVAKWSDSKDAKGNTVKGIGSLLSDINANINTARSTADGYAKNYLAYQADLTAYSKADLTDSIAKAITYVNAKATGNAKTFFAGLLSTYSTTNGTISTAIKKLYDTSKSTTSTQQTEIKNLSAAVQKVIDDVIPNETAYAANIKAIAATQKSWDALYDSLSVNDQSTVVKDYLARLAVQQATLNALKDNVNASFAKGTCAAYDGTAKQTIALVNTAIINIQSDQIKGYNDAIKDDNAVRYNAFIDAMKVTEGAYSSAITTINRFNSIKNADLRAELQSIIDANKAIYEYSSKIIAKKAEATSKFDSIQKLTDPVTFDLEETYKDIAVVYKNNINTALVSFTSSVNQKAKAIFADSLSYAINALSDAQSNIAAYNPTVISTSFKAVKDTIAFAKAAENEVDYAIVIDGIIGNYTKAKIDAMIAAGYVDAAAAEWSTLFDPIKTKYDKDIAVIKGYQYKNSSIDYVKQYTDLYSSKITSTAKNSTSALAKYNSLKGKLYKGLNEIKQDTIDFISGANVIYAQSKIYNDNQVANATAYGKMLLDIDTVQTAYNVVDKYVSAYVVKDSLLANLSAAQGYITGLKEDAESNKINAVSYLPILKINCDQKKDEIKKIIKYANMTEVRGLETAIGVLKTTYNTAASIKGISDATIVAFKTKIDGIEKGVGALNDTVMKSNKQDTLQVGLLAMENTIALTRSDIANYYDSQLAVNAYNTLTVAAKAVVDDYNSEVTLLNSYAKSVQTAYRGRLTNVNTVITGIQKDIESRNSANTILFYNDGLTNAIKAIADGLKNVTAEIVVAQAPITLNENMFVKLTGEANVFSGKVTSIKGKLDGYITKGKYDYTSEFTDITNLIKTDTTALKTAYKNVSLTATSKLADSTSIATKLIALESRVDHNESDSVIKNIGTSLNAAYAVFVKNKYTTDDAKTLNQAYTSISKAIDALTKYNSDAYAGVISKDVDGNDLKDDKGKIVSTKSINYLSEADAVVFGKIATLTTNVKNYINDVNSDNYILGDVTNDGSILVDDYNTIKGYVLAPTTAPTSGRAFIAADVNGDGNINIGDVTAVANIIINRGFAARVRAMRIAAVASTDAITLSSASEGTTQRIAINLKNSVAYVACQMDIKLPVGMTLVGESLSGRANGHTLNSNDLSDGSHRVVISTVENNNFNDSESAILYLDVNTANSSDIDKVSVSNIMFTDANARVYNFADLTSGSATGINGVKADQGIGSKIYSVGGKLLNTLQKGINIIRNADGSTKKIINK